MYDRGFLARADVTKQTEFRRLGNKLKTSDMLVRVIYRTVSSNARRQRSYTWVLRLRGAQVQILTAVSFPPECPQRPEFHATANNVGKNGSANASCGLSCEISEQSCRNWCTVAPGSQLSFIFSWPIRRSALFRPFQLTESFRTWGSSDIRSAVDFKCPRRSESRAPRPRPRQSPKWRQLVAKLSCSERVRC